MPAVCMNDPVAVGREEYNAGVAWHDAGNGCSSAASAMWRRGWLYAYHRSLMARFFKGRNNDGCQSSNRYWLRYHVELARKYRMV